ncbi:MAG: hypothetical protein H0T73_05915 [Ardenticatenales bacterium]|nr:hypothetical protein [Ardenticatenales bacterium]
MTALLEKLQPKSTPVTLPLTLGPAQVIAWHVAGGEYVWQGKSIVTVSGKGGERTITAPTGGTMRTLLVQPGQQVDPGTVIAHFIPEASSRAGNGKAKEIASAPAAPEALQGQVQGQGRESQRLPERAVLAPPEAAREDAIPEEQEPPASTKRRRSTMPPVEELTLEEPAPALPRTRSARKRPRIVKFTCDVTDDQVKGLRERVEELRQIGGNYALAEIERVMFDLLLALPQAELVRRLETRRDLEEAERYGYGNRPPA